MTTTGGRKVINEHLQEDNPLRYIPNVSKRLQGHVVDLIDDSYELLPDDEINVPPKAMPMLTLHELALACAQANNARFFLKDPFIIIQVKGNAIQNERIIAMVRGNPAEDKDDNEYWITCEPMDYFEDEDVSHVIVSTADIKQFFLNAGYGDLLRDTIAMVDESMPPRKYAQGFIV